MKRQRNGKKVKRVKRNTYRAVNLTKEIKYVDGARDFGTIAHLGVDGSIWTGTTRDPADATGNYSCMPVPAQGVGFNDRIGRKIFMRDLKIRGKLVLNQRDTDPNEFNIPYVRIIIARDTQTNGQQAVGNNILGPGTGQDNSTVPTFEAAIECLTIPTGWGRYEVVADKKFYFRNYAVFFDGLQGVNTAIEIPFKFNVKCNCEVNFSGTDGRVGAIIDNSYHLYAASSSQIDDEVNITYMCRTSFEG